MVACAPKPNPTHARTSLPNLAPVVLSLLHDPGSSTFMSLEWGVRCVAAGANKVRPVLSRMAGSGRKHHKAIASYLHSNRPSSKLSPKLALLNLLLVSASIQCQHTHTSHIVNTGRQHTVKESKTARIK